MTSVHRAFRDEPNSDVLKAFDRLYISKRASEMFVEAQGQLVHKARAIVESGTWKGEAVVRGQLLGIIDYHIPLKGTQLVALYDKPFFVALREQTLDDRTTRKNIHLMIKEADSRSDIGPGDEIQPETLAVFSPDGAIQLEGIEHPTLEMIENVSSILGYIEENPNI